MLSTQPAEFMHGADRHSFVSENKMKYLQQLLEHIIFVYTKKNKQIKNN